VPTGIVKANHMLDIIIYIGYITLAIALGLSLLFTVKGLLAAGKKALSTLAATGALVVLFVISYSVSEGVDVLGTTPGEVLATANQSRLVESGLFCFYIVQFAAIVTALYAAVTGALKKR